MRGLLPALLLTPALVLGCAERGVGPPPQSPALTRGADALPADVDVVIRLDLRRMKSALGAELVSDLRRATELATDRAGSEALLAGLFEQTDVIYVGLRARLAKTVDHVLVL